MPFVRGTMLGVFWPLGLLLPLRPHFSVGSALAQPWRSLPGQVVPISTLRLPKNPLLSPAYTGPSRTLKL